MNDGNPYAGGQLVGLYEGQLVALPSHDANFRTYVVDQAPPSVTTGGTTNVTKTSATLNGTVDPEGQATSYHFEYGTSTSYGSQTPSGDAGSGTLGVAEAANVTGLRLNKTYHYRIVATNATGAAYGEDETFRAKKTKKAKRIR